MDNPLAFFFAVQQAFKTLWDDDVLANPSSVVHWSHWLTVMYLVVWVLARLRFLFVYTRVYRLHIDRELTLSIIKCSASNFCIGGYDIVGRVRVPKMCIGFSQCFIITTDSMYVGMYGHVDVAVKVTRFAWHGALVPDPVSSTINDTSNAITTFRNISTCPTSPEIETFSEVAMPDSVPENVRTRSTKAANRMAAVYNKGKGVAQVFIISGSPGIGKSLSARMLAKEVDGELYSGYDPTRPGNSIWKIIYRMNEKPIIIVIEEFDVLLTNLMSGLVNDSDTVLLDAKCKATWNNLLDNIKLFRKVIVVMTTNLNDDQLLCGACKGDASLLRSGRVSERIDLNPHRI
jgi:hypothetical protein